ncbi:MAG: A24 family peptidase [Planctomycetes bacterium]|nr:A24 family peptidase [Planctomycetota bacterium]
MQSTTTVQPVSAQTPVADDLGIDRAFLLQLAQVPFFALGFVLLAFLSHVTWGAIAGEGARNFGPIVVLCAGMVLAAVIDGWAFKVPNWLTLSLVLSGWIIGLLHTCGVAIDAGVGGIGASLLCTVIGFAMLFPLLAIIGMGQGDVKMLMGFGAWIGAFFGGRDAVEILVWAFCLGAIVGGIFGLIMMVCRRKFSKNLSNFKEIFVDLRVMATMGPAAANQRATARRSSWDRLPYGIPLCIGFLGYLIFRGMQGTL